MWRCILCFWGCLPPLNCSCHWIIRGHLQEGPPRTQINLKSLKTKNNKSNEERHTQDHLKCLARSQSHFIFIWSSSSFSARSEIKENKQIILSHEKVDLSDIMVMHHHGRSSTFPGCLTSHYPAMYVACYTSSLFFFPKVKLCVCFLFIVNRVKDCIIKSDNTLLLMSVRSSCSVPAPWISFRPGQLRLMVEHFIFYSWDETVCCTGNVVYWSFLWQEYFLSRSAMNPVWTWISHVLQLKKTKEFENLS